MFGFGNILVWRYNLCQNRYHCYKKIFAIQPTTKSYRKQIFKKINLSYQTGILD